MYIRLRSDLICLFKIFDNFTDAKFSFNVLPSILLSTHNSHGNAFKLDIPKNRINLLKFSYVCRVIKFWNGLYAFIHVCDSLRHLLRFSRTDYLNI